MTTAAETLVTGKFIETTNATQFTATSSTILDAIYVTNTSASAHSLSMHIVEEDSTPDDSNLSIASRIIRAGETHLCYEVLGQVLHEGSFISAKSSDTDVLNLRVSGRVIT